MSVNSPTCNVPLPVKVGWGDAKVLASAKELICLRKLGHFRRHTIVYQISSMLLTTKITIKWSTKENR